jgi:hypothetical protein
MTSGAWHRLVLAARDDYRDGRVFLDSIELERASLAQNITFDRTTDVRYCSRQVRRAAVGRRLVNSSPSELIVLRLRGCTVGSRAEVEEVGDEYRSPLMTEFYCKSGEAAGSLLLT